MKYPLLFHYDNASFCGHVILPITERNIDYVHDVSHFGPFGVQKIVFKIAVV